MAERRIEYMPVGEVVRAARNPKAHDTVRLRQSVATFGFVEPIVLDERTGRLVAGHGRLDDLLARETGGESAPEGIIEREDGSWAVPVVRGWSSNSDAEAEAYLVASNRLVERGGWHDADLANLLESLQAESADLLDASGFSNDDLDLLLASVRPAAPEAPDAFPTIGTDLPTEHTCPRCGYEWSGSS